MCPKVVTPTVEETLAILADRIRHLEAADKYQFGEIRNADHFAVGSSSGGIVEAIANLPAAGGGVFIPHGVRTSSVRIDVPANVLLFGVGKDSEISYTGVGVAMAMREGASGDDAEWPTILRDFRITTSTGETGLRMRNVYRADVEGLWIDGFTLQGINLDAEGVGAAEFTNRIHRCTIRENGNGIRFTGTNVHAQDVLSFNRIQGNLDAGIVAVKTVNGLVIIGNECEGNTNYEMRFLNGAWALTIESNWMENNGQNAIGIQLGGPGAYRGVDIRANTIKNNHGSATGAALDITSTAAEGVTAVIFKANRVEGYAVGIDFNGKIYHDCDFEGNYYNVATKYLAAPQAVSSIRLEERANIVYWNPPNMPNDGDVVSTTVTVTGAVPGDQAHASLASIGANNVLISAHVSANDTVTVILMNKTGGAIDIANGELFVRTFMSHWSI